MNRALGSWLATAALGLVSACASARAILPPSGQTIGGPGKFDTVVPAPGAAPASFFFRAPRMRPDVCVTVLNTGETAITLTLEESIGASRPLIEQRIFAGANTTRCAPGVGSAWLECAAESAGKICSALWRVDQVRPKQP